MRPRVKIIYVRGTVAKLLTYFESLLEHTDWRFTLVSNGCTPDERRMLEAVAAAHGDRVDVRLRLADDVIVHGAMLDKLLLEEPSPYFCFIDSDVLATSATPLSSLLPNEDEVATCSCLPIWHRPADSVMPQNFEIASGRYLWTDDGRVIGVTYAAAYRTAHLREHLERWGVGLEQCEWNALPARTQAELSRRGFKHRTYDTAKVANVLIQTEDCRMAHREIPSLVHIGGQSGLFDDSSIRSRLRNFAWLELPGLYGWLWRVRGFSKAESQSLADLARRYSELVRLIDRISDGMPIEDRPSWLSESAFAAVAQLSGARVEPGTDH